MTSSTERWDRWIQRATVGAVLATALALIGMGVALVTQAPVATRTHSAARSVLK